MLVDQPLWHGTWLVGLGAVVLVLNLEEISLRRAVDDLETALLEYDLALDDVIEEYEPNETQDELLERWRQRREESRVQEERDRQREVEHRVDVLLKKIHQCGFEGLSEDEKRQLRQASRQYRERTPRPEETV
jgi:hypothetical protein